MPATASMPVYQLTPGSDIHTVFNDASILPTWQMLHCLMPEIHITIAASSTSIWIMETLSGLKPCKGDQKCLNLTWFTISFSFF